MTFIRTILGDISPEQLGVCYAHEHVIIDQGYATEKYPDFLLDDTARAAAELQQFYADGGRAMIDSMPCAAGRNAAKMAEVSRLSGVHLVVPTGVHLEIYYPPAHWSLRYSVEEMAELFEADIEDGIDANDYNGPSVRRTPYRAGLIKVAGNKDRLSDRNRRAFEAAALAHRRTGCPILTHTEQGTAALEQVELLARHSADLAHVVLSHTDRKPDHGYHREILSTGVKVEYDSAFRWPQDKPNHTRDLLLNLAAAFPDQLLLGMDAARRSYWKAYGGTPGLSFLLTSFRTQMMAAGLDERFLEKLFVSNPAAAYSFAEAVE